VTPSQLPESITFLLGPPARPDERANFDRYQAEYARPPEKHRRRLRPRREHSPRWSLPARPGRALDVRGEGRCRNWPIGPGAAVSIQSPG